MATIVSIFIFLHSVASVFHSPAPPKVSDWNKNVGERYGRKEESQPIDENRLFDEKASMCRT